tara:strand:+ start:3610 stop:4242 length:633 start_codon:yes stop_codon:yes gene_type:complete
MKISYGLTVCNEHEEIKNLIEYLIGRIDPEDEIIVVYDSNRVTDEVLDVLNIYPSVMYHPFNFQQNFLENKNFLNSKCSGDFIFQLDADEVPHNTLIANLKTILESNPVDLLITPRKNLVEDLTQEHIQQWKWHVNEQGWVNWPDPQKRIYKNDSKIQWSGHIVHGMVEGYDTFAKLPMDERFCIIHNKTINRQESQNDRYHKIETGELK